MFVGLEEPAVVLVFGEREGLRHLLDGAPLDHEEPCGDVFDFADVVDDLEMIVDVVEVAVD